MLLLVGIAAVYFFLNPAHYPFPRCPFYVLTGLYCPGCGSQRATHALLHGRVVQAASFNLLAVLAVPVLAIGAADKVRTISGGGQLPSALLYRPWLGWLTVGLTLTFLVLRNLPGPVGAWLAP
ncbi:MAG TPA: DUF2752 domain-containing protein [Hymenobacter sp.]|jgi:hypothetical protein